MNGTEEKLDVIVVGAGHAGVEAALASARMGLRTLCLTMNLDSVALCACNPAIGGTGKGHLVREIDALGGEMGLAADETFLQMRMLNLSKGPAVHSLRAQIDKTEYHLRMKRALEGAERLVLRQGECERILVQNGRIRGIRLADGTEYCCAALIICTGVYLKSRIHIGSYCREQGPAGLARAEGLSAALTELGFSLRRFKTGTPPRVLRRSLELRRMSEQHGDCPIPHFSFMTEPLSRKQLCCYMTYTNAAVHELILKNLDRSPMYSGSISAAPTRYCPSIEDKLVRFSDKERHQIFVEPEGENTEEMYVQGFSTSLPADVQRDALRRIEGMEGCELTRFGYAIEYDCIDPLSLEPSLASREIEGLYFAGQINGSSGYEEAAAQGLLAGINAAQYVKNRSPLVLTRSEAYIGVLADELATKGTNEPFRMMTSRVEYRLALRQDNADLRLTERGRALGLVSDERYKRLLRKREQLERARSALAAAVPPGEAVNALLSSRGESPIAGGARLVDLLKRTGIGYTDLEALFELPAIDDEARREVEIEAHYSGYIERENERIKRFRSREELPLPKELDYASIGGLRLEAVEKLNALRPLSLGQASRISGVSPSDVAVLMIKLGELRGRERDEAKASDEGEDKR